MVNFNEQLKAAIVPGRVCILEISDLSSPGFSRESLLPFTPTPSSQNAFLCLFAATPAYCAAALRVMGTASVPVTFYSSSRPMMVAMRAQEERALFRFRIRCRCRRHRFSRRDCVQFHFCFYYSEDLLIASDLGKSTGGAHGADSRKIVNAASKQQATKKSLSTNSY